MGARAGGGAEVYVVDLFRVLGITISILSYISARRGKRDIVGAEDDGVYIPSVAIYSRNSNPIWKCENRNRGAGLIGIERKS